MSYFRNLKVAVLYLQQNYSVNILNNNGFKQSLIGILIEIISIKIIIKEIFSLSNYGLKSIKSICCQYEKTKWNCFLIAA